VSDRQVVSVVDDRWSVVTAQTWTCTTWHRPCNVVRCPLDITFPSWKEVVLPSPLWPWYCTWPNPEISVWTMPASASVVEAHFHQAVIMKSSVSASLPTGSVYCSRDSRQRRRVDKKPHCSSPCYMQRTILCLVNDSCAGKRLRPEVERVLRINGLYPVWSVAKIHRIKLSRW